MINKSIAEDIANEMFEMSFAGYSTQELAAYSGVTESEAIFLQSGSTNVSQGVYNKMQKTINFLRANKKEFDSAVSIRIVDSDKNKFSGFGIFPQMFAHIQEVSTDLYVSYNISHKARESQNMNKISNSTNKYENDLLSTEFKFDEAIVGV